MKSISQVVLELLLELALPSWHLHVRLGSCCYGFTRVSRKNVPLGLSDLGTLSLFLFC